MGLLGLAASLCLLQIAIGASVEPILHPDAGSNHIEMIRRHGYPVEEHWATTSDGFILGIQRIPYAPSNQGEPNKPAVLIVHGLGSSAADFVNMGPERSIGYLLADRGYDVWLGNARGNTWSRNHTTMTPSEQAFWRHSWHQIGTIDLPTMIDYVLEVTGQENLYYIGHSQGTTSFFVMAADRPEYNDKIRVMAAMGPVAYLSNVISPLYRIGAQIWEDIEILMDELEIWEVGPHSDLVTEIGKVFCDDGIPYQDICANLLMVFSGFSHDQMDATMLPVIMTNAPAGASLKQYIHYAQSIKAGFFRQYDYGLIQNLNIYGQATPPDYNLGRVTAPVALFYSANDWMTHLDDVAQTIRELGNVVVDHLVEHRTFNHLDFLFGINANEFVYNHIFDLFEQY